LPRAPISMVPNLFEVNCLRSLKFCCEAPSILKGDIKTSFMSLPDRINHFLSWPAQNTFGIRIISQYIAITFEMHIMVSYAQLEKAAYYFACQLNWYLEKNYVSMVKSRQTDN